VFQVFYRGGPAINYEFSSASPLTNAASYSRIMNSPDTTGRNWAFLANEENYQYVREMQRKNLIVPLVGDFAGPAVIRNIGRYLKEKNATVTAFYVSNVESYLDAQQMQKFYANVATLPVDSSSTFIRFIDGNHTSSLPWWKSGMANLNLISPMSDLVDAVNAGRRPGYDEMLRTTKDPVVLAGLSRTPDLGVGPIMYVPKGGPAPAGYVLLGTVRQTIQFLNGTSTAVDFDVYTKKEGGSEESSRSCFQCSVDGSITLLAHMRKFAVALILASVATFVVDSGDVDRFIRVELTDLARARCEFGQRPSISPIQKLKRRRNRGV
jgi:hypothetical protein